MKNNLTNKPIKELPNILFLHLSKTAGKALLSSIRPNYSKESVLRVYGLPCTKNTFFPSKVSNDVIEQSLKLQYTQEQLNNIKFFAGHVSYGIHTMFEQKFDYITIMRDPIHRMISHYYFSIEMEPRLKQQWKSLEDYIINRTTLHNWMTKKISNIHKDGGDLDLAKKNISENFALCGITEMYQETLDLLTFLYGLQLKNVVINKTQDKPSIESIDSNIIDAIKTLHYKDVELYEFAKNLFVKKLKNTLSQK